MLVLDTNHIVELAYDRPAGQTLRRRLAESALLAATTIVCAEEQLRGWMAELHKARDPQRWIALYQKLRERIEFFASWLMFDWDAEATARFQQFRAQGVRIGTQDLKIACITLEHDAMLLTRNTVDFAKVPGLRFENWLD